MEAIYRGCKHRCALCLNGAKREGITKDQWGAGFFFCVWMQHESINSDWVMFVLKPQIRWMLSCPNGRITITCWVVHELAPS
jgi:hypothetical protein